jgi:Fe-S-cluster containining protein
MTFSADEEPWYAGGLRFKCTECGKCCTGASGSVYLSQEDLERLAAHFRRPVGAFVRKNTQMLHGRRALQNRDSGDCIFLNGKTCSVYEARPVQCRSFPWWNSNLRDPESWQEAAKDCEGIEHPAGQVFSFAEIREQADLEAENELTPELRRQLG